MDTLVPVSMLGIGGIGLAMAGAALWPRFFVSRSGWFLAALGVVTVLSVVALLEFDPPGPRLQIDPSTAPLLPAGDPAGGVYRQAVADFGDDEIYAVALECEEVFETHCLAELQRLSSRMARLEGVRSLASLVDVTSFRWVPEQDWIEIRPFIEDVPEAPAVLAELRTRALADPVYSQTLVGLNARAAALNLSFQKMDDAEFLASGLDDQISGILAEEIGSSARFHLAGRPHVKVHVYRGILQDLFVLIPLAMVVMALVLAGFFRTVRGVVLPLGTAVVANLWTFGIIAWWGQPLNLLTGLLAPMLLAIGSVYGVHVLARYEEEAPGCDTPAAAAVACLKQVRVPAVIAAVTTLTGLAALLLTDVPAVFEFGLFSMLGIACCALLAMAGIPACLARLSLPSGSKRPGGRAAGGLERVLESWARSVLSKAGAITLTWAALAVASLLLIPRIEVDTDYLSYFAREDPVRLDFEAVNQKLSGAVPLYIVIDTQGAGSLREPELLRALSELQDELTRVPGVSRTLSFLDSLKKLNRAFHADDPREERVPDTRLATTELLFMLPKGETSRFLTLDHSRANIIVRTGVVGSSAILRLERDLRALLDAHPLPLGARARITGNTILLSRSADGITRGQPRSVGFAALAIFVLISLGLRSPRLGAVAMVPNLIPVLIFFGGLGLGVAPLSLPVSLIGSMALGIAIDDTVHFLVRYRRERLNGADPEEAALRCTRRVGRPIAITSVMLLLGFGLMMISSFASIQEFGMLAAFTMAVCLATDLMLLPALLVRLRV